MFLLKWFCIVQSIDLCGANAVCKQELSLNAIIFGNVFLFISY